MIRLLWVAGLFVLGAAHVLAVPAGQVMYAAGEVRALGIDGSARPLTRGADILAGDTVLTLEGRIQIRFSDGGLAALQPHTRFRVDDYHYADTQDGNERSFLNLLRGGMRFVTGAIGQRNRANYKIRTVVATIGIRGSGGRVDLCVEGSCGELADGLYLTGNEDVLTLTNERSYEEVRPGEAYFVACSDCPIVRIDSGPQAHVDLDPTLPERVFERGQQRTRTGALLALHDGRFLTPLEPPIAPPEPPVVPPVEPPAEPPTLIPIPSGVGGTAFTGIGDNDNFIGGLIGGNLTFDTAGALTAYQDGTFPANTFTAATINHFDADGTVAWGLWTNGSAGGGYATSLGTSTLSAATYVASLSAVAPSAGTLSTINGTYAVFGSTPPIAINGGGIAAIGTANSVSGSFAVNFSGNAISYNLSFPLASQTFNLAGSTTFVGGGSGTDTRFLGGGTITSSGSACTPSCTGVVPFGPNIQGYITGLAGERIGANYGFTSSIGKITGAVVARPN